MEKNVVLKSGIRKLLVVQILRQIRSFDRNWPLIAF